MIKYRINRADIKLNKYDNVEIIKINGLNDSNELKNVISLIAELLREEQKASSG